MLKKQREETVKWLVELLKPIVCFIFHGSGRKKAKWIEAYVTHYESISGELHIMKRCKDCGHCYTDSFINFDRKDIEYLQDKGLLQQPHPLFVRLP